jgi:hypothetical protein
MPSPAVIALTEIKLAICAGEAKRDLIARCNRAIKTVGNIESRGEPTPPNTLAVQR